MTVNKFKNLKFYFFLLLILILGLFIYFITDKFNPSPSNKTFLVRAEFF